MTSKKQIRFPEDYSRDELIEIVKIQQEIIKEKIGKVKKDDVKSKCLKSIVSNRKLLHILNVPRSTFYDKRSKRELENLQIDKKLLEKIIEIWLSSDKNYGYRKIYESLRRTTE
jgi:hypothetical protein